LPALLVAAALAAWGTVPALPLEPLNPIDSLQQATVLIEHAKGHGTGIIVGPSQVLTAFHVVQGAPLDVTFFDGPAVRGEVRWHDEALDLALVEVAVPSGYPTPDIACDHELQVGQRLRAVGHPMHERWVMVGGELPTLTAVGGPGLVPMGFSIGLGTSGGPVFGDDGRVAGIALAILAERRSASAVYDEYKETGIGLMLPAAAFCGALEAG
jgi:S1-C subfamily serine protease